MIRKKHHSIKPSSARQAAFVAILASWNEEAFVSDTLKRWKEDAKPAYKDFRLAQEIAAGTTRMRLALDAIARTLSKKISLKRPGKALLYMAIYQHHYMDRIPLYAIADETIAIAKKICYKNDVAFINAMMRKLETSKKTLPEGDSAEAISVRYSYPQYFVEKLITSYGIEKAKDILTAGNTTPTTMVRLRGDAPAIKAMTLITEKPCRMARIDDGSIITGISASKKYYIQNSTPATLMTEACSAIKPPTTILDLCAAPGGKALLAHDIFPEAKLFLNDVSETKIALIKENLKKYNVDATTTMSSGETLTTEERFDLIIIDAPCTNSGTLARRAEARWRITEKNVAELTALQMKLIENAKKLLAPHGTIAYMTCSILKDENENIIEKARKKNGLKKQGYIKTILPSNDGADGGFVTNFSL
ncbi:MAG: methyltransferase domain-containing protein [Waddliaceae bacterium]|jgi:16S rRNA (cytosine967-C5)-methyltransferase|nr:methyltransferase domain-containing protein [Waddliaceae bacterium]MBT3578576.1 methyltransferase domain-containing protein [Waddliaceae bacterium]MBT4444498.1 methyltransferase domain-containing protein [Waddliaceae bacterium]MBT6928256.1 methyltransferase domain-containing protein [Waddliaceae bacterium]MBT7264912.1 methyltransferase domain-containing protein [Waddliaceae bacterium]